MLRVGQRKRGHSATGVRLVSAVSCTSRPSVTVKHTPVYRQTWDRHGTGGESARRQGTGAPSCARRTEELGHDSCGAFQRDVAACHCRCRHPRPAPRHWLSVIWQSGRSHADTTVPARRSGTWMRRDSRRPLIIRYRSMLVLSDPYRYDRPACLTTSVVPSPAHHLCARRRRSSPLRSCALNGASLHREKEQV